VLERRRRRIIFALDIGLLVLYGSLSLFGALFAIGKVIEKQIGLAVLGFGFTGINLLLIYRSTRQLKSDRAK